MSLATRCPACGTVFRVVQDQLRVSEGWVRCGQCQEVFNALESLFELSAEAPLPAPSPPTPTPPAAPTAGLATTPVTELDLSDPGVAAVAAEAPAAAPPVGAADAAADADSGGPAPAPSLPAPAAPVAQGAPSMPVFDPLISVSSLLSRPDVVEAAPPPAASPEAAPAPAPVEDEPVPWPTAPVQVDLLDPQDPEAPRPETPATAHGAAPVDAEAPPVPSDKELADHELPGSALGDEAAADAALRGHDESIDFAPAASAAHESGGGAGSMSGDGDVAPEPQREWQRKRPRRARGPDTGTNIGPHAEGSDASPLEPAFLRRAARDARWQLPAVRASLAAAAAVLGLLLVAQAAVLFRDGLAARWPSLQPALSRTCAMLGCRIDAPRALDRISLDGSKLTTVQVEAGSSAQPADRPLGRVLRFAAELHNAARHGVQAPALELSFTDPLGQVVARRVLLPDELGLSSGTIPAGGTWQVDTRLAVGELAVAGFSAEIFYP